MRTVIVRDVMNIPLGRQGENEAVRVIWPGITAKYEALYGSGVFTLAVQRKGDSAPYPAATTVEGTDLVWVITAADVANPGSGRCELTYQVGGAVAKSQTWETHVTGTLTSETPTVPPENPAKAWFDAILSQIGDLTKLTTNNKENLVAAINEAATTGVSQADGIAMRKEEGKIQYSTNGGETWKDLVALVELKGETGTPGKNGRDGITPTIGTNGNWFLGDTDTGKPSQGEKGGGSGDMLESMYDPQGKHQDIFAYADGVLERSAVSNLSSQMTTELGDQFTWQLRNFMRWGPVCLFTAQFFVASEIASSYGFEVFRLPYAASHRVWLNNSTNFYIDAGGQSVKRNSSTIAAGNYVLSGMYFTNDKEQV